MRWPGNRGVAEGTGMCVSYNAYWLCACLKYYLNLSLVIQKLSGEVASTSSDGYYTEFTQQNNGNKLCLIIELMNKL